MQMPYCPIVGTLGYVLSPDKQNVLLVHRNARPEDDQLGKYNGLGGKMEMNEDIVECMKREIYEEAGIECIEMRLRGTVNWTNFGPKGENWLGFIFLIDAFEGDIKMQNDEGELHWIPINKMNDLPIWDGDRLFLPLVFDSDQRIFHGYMPYDFDRPIGWSYTRI